MSRSADDFNLELAEHGLAADGALDTVRCPCGCERVVSDAWTNKTSAYASLSAVIELVDADRAGLAAAGVDGQLIDQVLDATAGLRQRVTEWCHGSLSPLAGYQLMKELVRWRRSVFDQFQPLLARKDASRADAATGETTRLPRLAPAAPRPISVERRVEVDLTASV